MTSQNSEWRPWSFTKNFAWGSETGLRQLYDCIRIGFDNELVDVSREIFRDRVSHSNRPDYIPLNFFLFNRPSATTDYVVVDELVFQALTMRHSQRFDKLALTAFNLSYDGKFKRSSVEQRRPALWAHYYVRDRISRELDWETRNISADDIEKFISKDARWKAERPRKVATNLHHLYKIGRIIELGSERVERWWVDALFLALDRSIADQKLDGKTPKESDYAGLLDATDFKELTGRQSVEKDLAKGHLLRLYIACGGPNRFSEEAVRERTELKLKDVEEWIAPNDNEPRGAVHLTNPRILKSIPAVCAMLATYAGFDIISPIEMEDFNIEAFIKRKTREALNTLKASGVRPTMSAEEVLRLTRER